MHPLFIEGGKKNGHDPKVLDKIWSDWEKFASYAFNKSHATCYSWVAYQTGYLKAHYPAEYMAALMTRRFAVRTEIAKLMEECKSLGVETLGPDVNESYVGFGVNSKGFIRFGLSAINGMGSSAADVIVKERLSNGPFKDIFDFAERVNLKDVNRKSFESLALSGAFDCFGLMREQYVAANNKGEIFLDALVRFGKQYQQFKTSAANSLFGMSDDVEIATPSIPDAEPWSSIDRLNKEKELVGIYLSAHPLDDYSLVLHKMCNTLCKEVVKDNYEALSEREEITFGGIVTNVNQRFNKQGKPFGIVTIEDFEGSGEIALFGEDWGKWSGVLRENCSVFITGKCEKRYATSSNFYLNVNNVEYLQTVRTERVNRFTVSMSSSDIDSTMVNDILTTIGDKAGKTELYFNIKDEENNTNVLLRSTNRQIEVSKELVDFVERHEKLSYSVN